MYRFLTAALATFALTGELPAESANLDGMDIYWIEEGAGPAIVFVHGWTCDTTAWTDQMAGFREDYRVIALDLPGHGLSGASADGRYTMELYARAVEAVRVAAGADDIVLVGHSMGAPVVTTYALDFPDRVAAIVAVDGSVLPPRQPLEFPQLEEGAFRGFRQLVIGGFFVDGTTKQVQDRVLHMMLTPSDERAHAVGSSLGSFVARPGQSVVAPALVVLAGSADLQALDREALTEFAPQAEVEVMAGTGHFLMMEKPDEFNALMNAFLEEIDF